MLYGNHLLIIIYGFQMMSSEMHAYKKVYTASGMWRNYRTWNLQQIWKWQIASSLGKTEIASWTIRSIFSKSTIYCWQSASQSTCNSQNILTDIQLGRLNMANEKYIELSCWLTKSSVNDKFNQLVTDQLDSMFWPVSQLILLSVLRMFYICLFLWFMRSWHQLPISGEA